MKVIRTSAEEVVLELGKWEKQLLFKILGLYPLIPSSYQKLTRGAAIEDSAGAQKLLDEALEEQRTENKKRLRSLLEDPGGVEKQSSGRFRMNLNFESMEWLLQVLNDIRVGSWIALGSPEDKPVSLDQEALPHVWAMEIAGLFQASFLKALEGDAED
jgi:hypothetical protein